MKIHILISFLLIYSTSLFSITEVVERIDAWTWSNEKKDYILLKNIRKTVNTFDDEKRLLKKKTFLNNDMLYSTEVYIYDNDIPLEKTIYDSVNNLVLKSLFQKEKSGWIEYLYNPTGKLAFIFYNKTDNTGRIVEQIMIDSSSNIITRKKIFYDCNDRVFASIVYDPYKNPLVGFFYEYNNIEKDRLMKDEMVVYAGFKAPRERVVISNIIIKQKKQTETKFPKHHFTEKVFYDLVERLCKNIPSSSYLILSLALEEMKNKRIIKGSCWEWVNYLYNKAGYTDKNRKVIFSSKKTGPYVNPLLIMPGDWIMFKNQTLSDIEHSGLFVEWIDFDKKSALIISYVGQNKDAVPKFKEYDITKTFYVIRGGLK